MNFTAIDFETAIGKRYSICQIGMVVVENNQISREVVQLIKPPNNEYSPYNIQIHGINPEDTVNSPTFSDIWEKMRPYIEGKLVVAHNAAFDVSCLRKTLEYYDLPFPEFEVDCTYKRTKMKLDLACQSMGIDFTNHHDALADARACAQIYYKIMINQRK
jgi:DNA polymerase-3 subunit epsilon